MSADNYITIYKHNGQYYGFMLSASENLAPPAAMPKGDPWFIVNSKIQAIDKCEDEILEYGYEFIGE